MSCSGTVKSFNGGKGFGFIDLAGEDVFVHIKDCQDGGVPQTGDLMSFEIEENPNKPGAKKALKCNGGTGKQSDMKGAGKGFSGGTGAYNGVCKSFNGMKAWGFVTHDGADVFFHLKDMVDGSAARAGDNLRFDLEDNPQKPGSMKAKNVSGGTGWPEPKGGCDKGKGKGMDKGGYGAFGGGGGWGGPDMSWKGGGGWGAPDPWGPYGGGGGGWGKDGGKGGGWGGKDSGKGWGMDWGKGGGDGWAKGGW